MNSIDGNTFRKTHGMSKTRQYRIWYDMKRRCCDPKVISYPYYGGIGISYDSTWETFEGFWEDMGDTYEDDLTLDRKDSSKNYSKDNCRWASYDEQAQNKGGYKSNSLGSPNMSLIKTKGHLYLRVRITNPKTKQRPYISFNMRDYDLQTALELASKWLHEKKLEFGYSKFHGRVQQ